MKVVSFTPIKLNNQRLPGKNIQPLSDGTPLCQLMFNTLNDVPEIDESYCFCSKDEIKDYLVGKIQFLKRDSILDGPDIKSHDLVQAFIEKIDADIYVMANVTAPFLKHTTISDCISAVKSGRYDSSTTVCNVNEFLWNESGPMNYDPANIIRTQDMKKIIRETTGVYVFRKEVFTKHKRKIGFTPYFKTVGAIEGLDLDYPEDFEIIDAVYSKKIKNE